MSNAKYLTEKERFALEILHCFAPAVVVATAMIVAAVVPRQLGGLPFTAALILCTPFLILARRLPRSPARPRGWGVVYVVARGGVMTGSLWSGLSCVKETLRGCPGSWLA